RLLQVADLPGGEVVVEDDDVGLGRLDGLHQLLELALADVAAGVDVLPLLAQPADDDGAGGLRQAAQLVQRVGADERPVRQRDADEEGFFQLDVEFFARGIERHWGYYLHGDALLYARRRLRREVNLPITGRLSP